VHFQNWGHVARRPYLFHGIVGLWYPKKRPAEPPGLFDKLPVS
jgi:hypothetical protein